MFITVWSQSSCKHVLEFFSLDYDILMNGVQVHYFFMMSELRMFCMLVLTHIFSSFKVCFNDLMAMVV